MNKVIIYRVSILISMIFTITGGFFKVIHFPHSDFLLCIGLFVSLIFISLGLFDVYIDEDNKSFEKIMWLAAFVFLSWIAGIIYLPRYTKRNEV